MSQFTDDARRLDRLATDYQTAALGIKAANAELTEIIVGISTRIQLEQQRNEDRAKDLRETINDTKNRTAIVRKLAAQELERLEAVTPAITPDEEQLFIDRLNEANAAVEEMRQIERTLTSTRAELKREIDENFKLSKISSVDAQLLSRHIEDKHEEFKRRFRGE